MGKTLPLSGKRFSFIRKISKMGPVYIITVPKQLGQKLYGQHIQVTIEIISEVDN